MAVYILRFSESIGTDKHRANYYVGYVNDSKRSSRQALDERLATHRAGQGAAITRWASEHSISFEVVAFYPKQGRALERQIKNYKNTARWLNSKVAKTLQNRWSIL